MVTKIAMDLESPAGSYLTSSVWTEEDHGYAAWAFDPALATASTVMSTAGVMELTRVKLVRPFTVATITIFVGTAGATLANSFAGLYDSGGTLRAFTTDQSSTGTGSSNWASVAGGTNAKAMSLTATGASGSYAAAPGYYWVGLLVGSATTLPAIARGPNVGSGGMYNIGLSASATRFATYGTSQTSLPSPLTLTSLGANNHNYWAALS